MDKYLGRMRADIRAVKQVPHQHWHTYVHNQPVRMCTRSPLVLALKPDLSLERLVHYENLGLDSIPR